MLVTLVLQLRHSRTYLGHHSYALIQNVTVSGAIVNLRCVLYIENSSGGIDIIYRKRLQMLRTLVFDKFDK